MLAIRMQRLGRRGHPSYRVVVQDSRQSPSSGKFVALLGSYDPHTKQTTLVKEKAEFYLKNGAQPSDRVTALFKSEKIKLPNWASEPSKKSRQIKNPEKLRKNRPADAEPNKAETPEAEAPAEEAAGKPEQSAEPPKQEPADQESKPEEETKPDENKATEEKETAEEKKATSEKPEPEAKKPAAEPEPKKDAQGHTL